MEQQSSPIKVLPGCKERQGNPAAPLSELGSAKAELQSRGFCRTTTLFCGAVRARLTASEVRGLATTHAGYPLFCSSTGRPGAPLAAAAPLHDAPACLFSGATRAPSHDLSVRLDRTAGLRTLGLYSGQVPVPARAREAAAELHAPRCWSRRQRLGGEALPGPHAAASSVVQARAVAMAVPRGGTLIAPLGGDRSTPMPPLPSRTSFLGHCSITIMKTAARKPR